MVTEEAQPSKTSSIIAMGLAAVVVVVVTGVGYKVYMNERGPQRYRSNSGW